MKESQGPARLANTGLSDQLEAPLSAFSVAQRWMRIFPSTLSHWRARFVGNSWARAVPQPG